MIKLSDDDTLHKIFDNLGLTDLQGKILIELMKMGGEGTAPEIHERVGKSSFKRPTVYSSLDHLVSDKLVFESDQDGKHKVYGLKHSSPEQLIQKLTQPREAAIKSFKKLLEEAKEESKKKINLNPLSYYSLRGKDKIISQIASLIYESQKYILIQANTTMLKEIFDFVKQKIANTPDIRIFVQMTWNPDPSLNIDSIFSKYVKLLGEQFVSKPHQFYDEIFGLFQQEFPERIPETYRSGLFEMQKMHFIQLLTDEGSVVGVHFGGSDGGGHFTRDPYTTQSHYMIFFLIFETSKKRKVDREILKEILTDRVLQNLILASRTSS